MRRRVGWAGWRRGSARSLAFASVLNLVGIAVGITVDGAARGSAEAAEVLDRVRAEHVVRCGAVARPGLAGEETEGLLSDICRAIGLAASPTSVDVAFRSYESDASFGAVRQGEDDVFFLTASEVIDHHLAGMVVAGPVVYLEATSVMVPDTSPVHRLADLADQPICFMQGSNAHRNLEAWFAASRLNFIRMGYQEEVEAQDAFSAHVCRGLAWEETTLAEAATRVRGRVLEEPLTRFPILAMTGTRDAAWSALVAWTVDTLIAADLPSQNWAAGGLDALPIEAPELGLERGWQRRVVASVGSYEAIRRRNLGASSRLKLPAGANAHWHAGGALLAPLAE